MKRAGKLAWGCAGTLGLLLVVVLYAASRGGEIIERQAAATRAAATAAPTEPPTDVPPPTATPDVAGALASLSSRLDEANAAAGADVFQHVEIDMLSRDTPHCVVTMSDAWYAWQRFERERILGVVADACAQTTALAGLRGDEPDETNYPQTTLVDAAGKRLARRSSWGSDDIEDVD